jgi:hypothetical protein
MEKNEQTRSLLEIIKEVEEEMGLYLSDTATGGGLDAFLHLRKWSPEKEKQKGS